MHRERATECERVVVIRLGSIGLVIAAVFVLVLAGWSAPTSGAHMSAAATQVHGKGRLLSRVLVFGWPPKGNKRSATAWYQVYFRSAGSFAGTGHEFGTIQVDESISRESDGLSHLGGGRPRGRCYLWTIVTSRKEAPKLVKKRVGDTVVVRLHAYHTALQVRKVRMLAWTTRAASGNDPDVKRAIRKIGCHA